MKLAALTPTGMRADWILTDEERLTKRQKIEENRRLRQMLYPDSSEADDVSVDTDLREIHVERSGLGTTHWNKNGALRR